MPIYNSTEYLSVPQQVNKNKSDIAALDTRMTAAEAAILGNTSVTMSDDINVAQLGVDYALSLAGANDLKAVIDYNHAAPDTHMLYGAKVILPASIVNDSIVFPNANDVGYDIVFAIEARQVVNPVTEEYTYVAQGSSPEFAFTINFSYRFDTAAYVVSPTIRVMRQEDMEYDLLLTGEATAPVPKVAVSWVWDNTVEIDPSFTGSIWIWVAAAAGGPYNLAARSHVVLSSSPGTNGYSQFAATYIDEAVQVSATEAVFGIDIFGRYGGNNFYRIYVKADDHRKLTNTNYASLTATITTIPHLDQAVTNAISDHTNITTGSPYTASNYANKQMLLKYNLTTYVANVAIADYNVSIGADTFTSITTFKYYTAVINGYLGATTSFAMCSCTLTNNTMNVINIATGGTITITFSSAGIANTVQPYAGHIAGHIKVVPASTGFPTLIHGRVLKSGVTLLIYPRQDGLTTISVNPGASIELGFIIELIA